MSHRAGLDRCGKSRPTGIFFTMILYWSRYLLFICKSILSRQSFASFMSRLLAAGAVASDAPYLPIGFSSLCMCVCVFFFLGRCPLLWGSYVVV